MNSILVALDGSKDALNASQAAWQLARKTKSKIVALSVVDTQSIWDFLGHKLAGMIGSGVYISAFQSINSSLQNIAESLLTAFESRSNGYGIETSTIVGEGNLAEVVLKNAQNHDLIIMGRRAKFQNDSHTILRTSLSAKVAEAAPIPVLMVSSEPLRWTTARFILDSTCFDNRAMKSFFKFAEDLKLQPEIFCLDAKSEQWIEDLNEPSKVSEVVIADSVYDDAWHSAFEVTSSTLLVVPTTIKQGKRYLADGRDVGQFLATLSTLSLMILPPHNQPVKTHQAKVVVGTLA
jgi:nucleotide-binding universal stress UspA family protein